MPSAKLDVLKDLLNGIPHLQDLRLDIAVNDDGKSFYVLDIRSVTKLLQTELQIGFDMENKGQVCKRGRIQSAYCQSGYCCD